MGIHENFALQLFAGRRGGPHEGKYIDWPERLQEIREELAGDRPLAPLDAPLVQLDGAWLTYREYLELNIKAMEQAVEENPGLKGAPQRIEVEWRPGNATKESTLAAVALIEAGKTLKKAVAESGAKRGTVVGYFFRLGTTWKKYARKVARQRRKHEPV